MFWGRKDGFPGADGSTIQANGNATTISIYDASGNTLIEGSATGLQIVNITTSGVLSGNTSQMYAIKNPLTYVYNGTNTLDWYTTTATNQNNTLWSDGDIKSANDPCPYEWRIPTNSKLSYGDFSKTTMPISEEIGGVATGRTYHKMAWYPAAGYREHINGILSHVGSTGFYWSTAVSNMYAIYLGYDINNVSPGSTYSRAYGFPVRCVQE